MEVRSLKPCSLQPEEIPNAHRHEANGICEVHVHDWTGLDWTGLDCSYNMENGISRNRSNERHQSVRKPKIGLSYSDQVKSHDFDQEEFPKTECEYGDVQCFLSRDSRLQTARVRCAKTASGGVTTGGARLNLTLDLLPTARHLEGFASVEITANVPSALAAK
ncbi:hypothetical protein AXG93_2116s1400 [Marchantia polymorpha subsp. ruderalis]|uniref:Uncharacterized protein n=1 Tax=Marchantia polymorpha subsp. ruderalis TaxID=1480154 RepID=A0A176VKR9_MARPO|nr:hypothetical protein AXG93_2116s1400 [Marchantia polymorpha subsp. ruderalis]